MKRVVVVFQSKYGYTKKYAHWLADSLSCDIMETDQVSVKQLEQYDIILLGGGIYAGGISGASLYIKNFNVLKEKTLVLFTVGLADPQKDDIFSEVKKQFNQQMLKTIHFFHLRGGIDFPSLSLLHRAMMGMMKKMLLKKPETARTESDRGLLDIWGTKVDYTDRESLNPILFFVKDHLNQSA